MKYLKHIWIATGVMFLANVAFTVFSMVKAFNALGKDQDEIVMGELASAISISLYAKLAFVVVLALAIIASVAILIANKISKTKNPANPLKH